MLCGVRRKFSDLNVLMFFGVRRKLLDLKILKILRFYWWFNVLFYVVGF